MTARPYPLSRHASPDEFEAHGNGWTVDLAPCDPKVRLLFRSVEAEVHYPDAERLAYALLAAVSASRLRWAAKETPYRQAVERCGQRGPGGDCPEPAVYVVTVSNLHGLESEGPAELAACVDHAAELRQHYPDAVLSARQLEQEARDAL